MGARRIRPLAVATAALLALAGCGGDPGTDAARSEPVPAEAERSAAAAADPAAATTPAEAALAVALRATDLPAGWSVQANPVPDGDLTDDPSLAGFCDATFSSESRRTAKFPVAGLDPSGMAAVVSEAIAYDSTASAALALSELRTAVDRCPTQDQASATVPHVEGLADDAVVVGYHLADGTTQTVVAQTRGAVLSVLIGEDAAATAGAAQAIAGRLAALPDPAIGR